MKRLMLRSPKMFFGVLMFLILGLIVFSAYSSSIISKDNRTLVSFSLDHGQINCATPGTTYPIPVEAEAISVRALSGNTGKIYVGGSTVSSSNGYELSASESIDLGGQGFYIAPNTIYVTCGTGNDKISWIRLY